jgi:hypothetical protein
LTNHLEDVLTSSRLHAQVSDDYTSRPLEISNNPVQAGQLYIHPLITPVDLNEVVTIVSDSPVVRFLAGSERSVKSAFKQVPELFEVASRTIQGHRSEYLLWPGVRYVPELYVTQIPHTSQYLYQLFARDYSFEVGTRALAGLDNSPVVANHVVRDIQTRPLLLGVVTDSANPPTIGVTAPLVPYHEYYSSYGATQRDVSAHNFIGGLDFRPQVVHTVNSYAAVLEQFVPNNVSARLADYSGQNIGVIFAKTLNQRLNVDNSIDFGKHRLANDNALHSVDSTISFHPGQIPRPTL